MQVKIIAECNTFDLHLATILMHLQKQRDVWLDKVINLQQYILRYTVANPTSLGNVTFHLVDKWIYAAGKRFYAAGSRWTYRNNKVHFCRLFEGKMLIVH